MPKIERRNKDRLPREKATVAKPTNTTTGRRRAFHLEFLNAFQKIAWSAFDQHDILFLLGPAGTGKSHLAIAFAIQEILSKKRSKIVLTRPTVEAGEKLGFLPGTFEEKVDPYLIPLFDCMDRCVGREGPQREFVNHCVEKAPLAFMRGRSQPLDAIVYTISGQKQMGDLQPGDKVVGVDGKATEVLDIYPQGELDIYRVMFSDGTSTECSEDHLWSTMTLSEKRHSKGYSVKNTAEIAASLKNKHNQKNHRVPVAAAVEFQEQELPLDPYLLGVLLGDGNFTHNVSPKVSNVDPAILDEVADRLPSGMALRKASKYGCDYRLVTTDRRQRNPVKSALRELGLFGKLSWEKSIPDLYKFSSKEQRLALLKGLMDTDGTIFKHRSGNCRVQFFSTSKVLAGDVRFLAHSLGGTASIRKREYDEDDSHSYKGNTIRHCRPMYIVDMVIPVNPFMTPRKAGQYSPMAPVRLISKIEKVGRKECQCISVDHSEHLYLTDHCLVTHNTFHDAVCIFDEAQNATRTQLKLFLTRFGHNSKVIVTGDPSQSDLPGEVALVDVVRRLEGVPGVGVIQFQANSIVRNPLIAKILEKLGDD